ncbi:hypothetical protein [Rhabdothermincola sediminis]|uniref:hypothetical protein n=1 Tax=Rhabdothermincola sediminis TaxID=2751370 RepID=UPI001AA050BF|nr:hypothetical protein [Rhabdothermincola sediminis]
MTLLYRAIWQDDRDALIDEAERVFAGWLQEKRVDVALPDEGAAEGTGENGPVELLVRRALAGDVEAVQFELAEERPRFGERWTTRLTAIDGGEGERWLWVDLERVADVESVRPPLAAPRLVRALLADGVDARVDQVRISATPQRLGPVGLAGLIRNQQRTLPLVVFSEEPAGYTPTLRRAEETAARLAAAVQVVLLRGPDTEAFNELIGEGLGVWGGAARVYLPNAGPGGLRPDRHRYVRLEQMAGDPVRATKILSTMLAQTITARRPPAVYERVRRELRLGRSRSDAELLALAEAEIARLTDERNSLKNELRDLEDDLLDTQADLEEAVVEASRLRNQLQVMLAAGLGGAGGPGAAGVTGGDATAEEEVAELACEAGSISEALELARERLTGVVIPPGVERDVDDLDSHINASAWGELTWRGLRALHRYAEARFDGNFRQWCEQSRDPWVWPASQKKLALRESEMVESNARFAEQRRFPVDPRVDPSGSIVMWAHLKIAEGGGPMAPRVYFHDDTRGETGKVHVGFVGPHRYTENTRTN